MIAVVKGACVLLFRLCGPNSKKSKGFTTLIRMLINKQSCQLVSRRLGCL